MELELVDSRDHPSLFDDALQMMDEKIGYPNVFHLVLFLEVDERLPCLHADLWLVLIGGVDPSRGWPVNQ